MDAFNLDDENKDVFTFFENNQKLGISWSIKVDCKMELSVMTNIIHIKWNYQ